MEQGQIVSDWFMPAFVGKQSVYQCLESVKTQLDKRSEFVAALQDNLAPKELERCDAVTDLKNCIHIFQNTLNFRVGMLLPDRRGAWFRESMKRVDGPFPTRLLSEPVFNEFKDENLGLLKERIVNSYRDRKVYDIPFEGSGSCLWLSLLQLNRRWEQIVTVTTISGATYRLDQLPAGLPAVLDTMTLRSFLLNVKGALLAVRSQLDECYQILYSASVKFWEYLQAELAKESEVKNTRAQFRSQTQSQAHEYRENLKQRRSNMREQEVISIKERRALQFMAFDSFPDIDTLKKRYRQLARRYHPDTSEGKEDEFKKLTHFYSILSVRIQSRNSEKS